MATFTHGEVSVEVDDEGFLERPEVWSDDVARALATTEGVAEMSEAHWRVVRFLRTYHLRFGTVPTVRKLCKETGFQLKEIYQLFPSGPARGACRVAGLPRPAGCV